MTTSTVSPLPTTVTAWQIDPDHSQASFSVRQRLFYLLRMTVQGRFPGITGTIALDTEALERSSVTATIPTSSIDTSNGRRDKHLRSADFFDVERFPTMTFRSRAVTLIDQAAGHYRISGDLTARNNTRPVELDVRVASAQDPSAGRLQLTATATLNRRDFGLGWSSPFSKVIDEVPVTLEIDAVAQ
ncbi:MAG: YceI family protein [Dehalococcoidia bacterium]